MAHVTHHSRPLSDSSLLVSCLQHRRALSIAAPTNEQNSSIPTSSAASLGVGLSTLKMSEAQEIVEGLPTPTALATAAPRVKKVRNGSWQLQQKECQDELAYQRSLRGGRTRAQDGYLQCVVEGEPAVSSRKSLSMNAGRNPTNTVSSCVGTPQHPFTPPIRPRTSSLSGTLLHPISEGTMDVANLTPSIDEPTMYRRISSSEPFLNSSAVPSRRTVQSHPLKIFSDSREDVDVVARLHNARHSSESLSCLKLSLAEKRTISRGIEKDVARATERAEERRRTTGARKFAGIARSGLELSEVKDGTGNDEIWPNRDELLDPIEVQAMGILVPLMEMRINEVGKGGGHSGFKNQETKAVQDTPKQVNITRTIKHRGSAGEAKIVNQPSIVIGSSAVFNQQGPESSQKTMSSQSTVHISKPESLRHKISGTFLRCMGQLGLVGLEYSPRSRASTFQSGKTPDTGVSLPHEENKQWSQWWARSHRQGTKSYHSSTFPSEVETINTVHPLKLHIGSISHKAAENPHTLRPLLSVFRRKDANVLIPQQDSHRGTDTQIAGIWNGCSWESEKFMEAGKYIEPAIGDGELVLKRDFSSASKSLRKSKKLYTSLRPPAAEFKVLPPRANVSWTNILHEFSGTLGDVKESGVRPIGDHRKASTDSLVSSVTTKTSSLGRIMLASSSECLTTTEMEEYERDDELPFYIGSTDDSESSDQVESENMFRHIVYCDDTDDDKDDENCHGNPGNGYSSSGDEGSGADDDEDSKLRVLLHQVGRTYVGYSASRDISSARRLVSDQRKEVVDTKRQNTYRAPPSMGLPRNVTREGLGKLTYSAGNARLGSLSIDSCGTPATKSTLAQENYTLAADENTKPSEEKDLQTDYADNGEIFE